MKVPVLCDNCKKEFLCDEQKIEEFEVYCPDCLEISDFDI